MTETPQKHHHPENYLVRAISDDGGVLALACVTTDLVARSARRHGTSPVAAAALGRSLTGGALLASLLKEGQGLALKFEADGPLGKIVVEAERDGSVRGYVQNPEADVPDRDGKLDVSGALGKNGFLTVLKDLGLKEPYQGIVRLRSGEIAQDLAYYLLESEQIPSAIALGVYVESNDRVSAAGGFLVQSLPPPDPESVERIASRLEAMLPVTALLQEGKTPEDLLRDIFSEIPFRILETQPLTLRCSCSRSRIERVLLSLGADELKAILDNPGEAEVNCHFCRIAYRFNREELAGLIRRLA
ncbi:MAG: Hsp33 family molecular chaperone HslO [Syntrophaceae bacterium]|nr:Hsp33 family molecular chaperone HslO [Syntrophaceae bacterium]